MTPALMVSRWGLSGRNWDFKMSCGVVGVGKMRLVAFSEDRIELAQLLSDLPHLTATVLGYNKKALLAAGFVALDIQIKTVAQWKSSVWSLGR